MNTLTTFNKCMEVTTGPHTIKLNGKNDLAIFIANACSLCSYSHSWTQTILSMVTNRKGNCSESRCPSNKDNWYKCLILRLPRHLVRKNAFKDETSWQKVKMTNICEITKLRNSLFQINPLTWNSKHISVQAGLFLHDFALLCLENLHNFSNVHDNVQFNAILDRWWAIIFGLTWCGIHELWSLVLCWRKWCHCHSICHVYGLITLVI